MTEENGHDESHHDHHGPGRGLSSFWMHDPQSVFHQLDLKPGDWFLNLGCGPGDYTLLAAELVGYGGMVFALDKWQHVIDELAKKAITLGYNQIKTIVTDITQALPIEDQCIDVCLLATVLHIFPRPNSN